MPSPETSPGAAAAVNICCLFAAVASAACSGARTNPCDFLTVAGARSVDSTVTTSRWVGRSEARTDNEVCIFYTENGDARIMLFVWYGDAVNPKQMVMAGSKEEPSMLQLSGAGLSGFASFGNGNLQLLAAGSARRTIGFRVRKPVRKASPEFDRLVQLTELVLSK